MSHPERKPADVLSELERCREALRLSEEALRRANADLEQFSWLASHELQEPLRMVTLFSQMLQEKYVGKLDSQAEDYINYSVDGATRIQALVRDLIEYTQASKSCLGRAEEVVEVSSVVSGAIANLRDEIAASGCSVKSGLMPRLRTHAAPLEKVFQHLICNAVKFRGEEPVEIAISASPRKTDWLFCVADNGMGMDPQYRQQIFGLFKRLHPPNEYPGSGIGLAVCRRIVEALHGLIWVESTPGEGSSFYFTLPRGL